MPKRSGDERRSVGATGGGPPQRRMSRGQELTLFVVLVVVLMGLVIYGLRA